jgi:hypothetical protein
MVLVIAQDMAHCISHGSALGAIRILEKFHLVHTDIRNGRER